MMNGPLSANERLKQQYPTVVSVSLLAATSLTFALFQLAPPFQIQDVSFRSEELEMTEITQEFEIPPPPEEIMRPAVPVLSTDVNISEDITIGEVTFEENPVSELPPPPVGNTASEETPKFTPYEVAPRLKNRKEVERLLARHYPSMLQEAGIGGTTLLWFLIDEEGAVIKTQVKESSGYEEMDRAAKSIGEQMQFTPAYNRDQKVQVWIALPITFQVK